MPSGKFEGTVISDFSQGQPTEPVPGVPEISNNNVVTTGIGYLNRPGCWRLDRFSRLLFGPPVSAGQRLQHQFTNPS